MSAKRSSAVVAWPRALVYAVAAVVMGVVVGELAAMLIFAGSSERRLDEQAARSAGALRRQSWQRRLTSSGRARRAVRWTTPWWTRAAAATTRWSSLAASSTRRPACPQTHITGVPGSGPENRTANGFLADTQQQLDKAVLERDRLAPSLDAAIADDEQKLTKARDAATATATGASARAGWR